MLRINIVSEICNFAYYNISIFSIYELLCGDAIVKKV